MANSLAWKSVDFSTLLLTDLTPYVSAMQSAQLAVAAMNNVVQSKILRTVAVGVPSTFGFGLDALRIQLLNLVNSWSQLAVHMAWIPPREGGWSYLNGACRDLMSATWDPAFPNYSPLEDTWALGLFAEADEQVTLKLYMTLTNIFAQSEMITAVSKDVLKLVSTGAADYFIKGYEKREEALEAGVADYVPHWKPEQYRRFNNPFLAKVPAWQSTSVLGFIPNGITIAQKFRVVMDSLLAVDTENPLATFARESAILLDTINDDIANLTGLLQVMKDAFATGSISVLFVRGDQGGTPKLRGLIDGAFDPSHAGFPGRFETPAPDFFPKHPSEWAKTLPKIKSSLSYGAGMLLVSGGDVVDVEAGAAVVQSMLNISAQFETVPDPRGAH
jgi:hypothetical protein